MLNRIMIMGRLTRVPELRYTRNGTPVASFSVACERDFASEEGGKKITDFIDVVAWGKTGEFAEKYFTKGQMALVSGRLQLRDWTDRNGEKRRAAEVIAEQIYFAGDKKSRDADRGESESVSAYNNDQTQEFEELEDDGELPF